MTTRLCHLRTPSPRHRLPCSLEEVRPGDGVPWGLTSCFQPLSGQSRVKDSHPALACLQTPHRQGFACLSDGARGTRQSLSSALRCPWGEGSQECPPRCLRPHPLPPGLPSPQSTQDPGPLHRPGSAVSLLLLPGPRQQLVLTHQPGRTKPDPGRFPENRVSLGCFGPYYGGSSEHQWLLQASFRATYSGPECVIFIILNINCAPPPYFIIQIFKGSPVPLKFANNLSSPSRFAL